MPRKRKRSRSPIEEALAQLIQNEASFLGRMVEADREISDMRKAWARIDQTIAKIMPILERLPDAIRDQIGFLPQQG